MSIKVELKDAGTGRTAKVTSSQELVTGPLSPSTPTSVVTIDVAVTAFNLQVPLPNRRFRLTDIVISSDKSVNVNGAIVEIYEAQAPDSTTQTRRVLELNLNRQDRFALTGLNWELSEGVWLNGESDETNITITVAGYYVDV